jgi:hypothetical protein
VTPNPTRSGLPATSPAATRATRFGVVAIAVLLAGACGGDGRAPDPEAFCAAFEELRANDPFAELAVASPGEMRDAFAELAAGAEQMAQTAPDDVEVQARRYAEAVEDLRAELAGAGYDPRLVDTRRYGAGVRTYTEAAESLGNAAGALCD